MDSILKNKVLIIIASLIVIGGGAFVAYSLMDSNDNNTDGNSQTTNEGVSDRGNDQNQDDAQDQTVEGRLVDGFPGDKIPLYLGDVTESKRSTSSFGKAEYNVEILTSDDMKKVVDRTETSYMNEGWEIRSRITDSMFIAHSDEYIVTVSFAEADNGVLINYGISTK